VIDHTKIRRQITLYLLFIKCRLYRYSVYIVIRDSSLINININKNKNKNKNNAIQNNTIHVGALVHQHFKI